MSLGFCCVESGLGLDVRYSFKVIVEGDRVGCGFFGVFGIEVGFVVYCCLLFIIIYIRFRVLVND